MATVAMPRCWYSCVSATKQSRMCSTKGQWLQMKATSSPRESLKSSSVYTRPAGSAIAKAGAGVPISAMIDWNLMAGMPADASLTADVGIESRTVRLQHVEQRGAVAAILHGMRAHVHLISRLQCVAVPTLASHDVDAVGLDIPGDRARCSGDLHEDVTVGIDELPLDDRALDVDELLLIKCGEGVMCLRSGRSQSEGAGAQHDKRFHVVSPWHCHNTAPACAVALS